MIVITIANIIHTFISSIIIIIIILFFYHFHHHHHHHHHHHYYYYYYSNFLDGHVRVRGLSSDEQNTTLLNNQRTSSSSFGQMSGQVMLTYGANWGDNEPWPTKSHYKKKIHFRLPFFLEKDDLKKKANS